MAQRCYALDLREKLRRAVILNVMHLPAKPYPILASFMASAVALLPLLAMVTIEIVYPDETDDSGFRGAAIAIGIMPLLYIILVPICYIAGTALASFCRRRFGRFMLGSAAIAIILGVLAGAGLSFPSRFGFNDVVLSSLIVATLFLISTLPAALCWWFLAVRPHSPSLNTDAPPNGGAPVG